MTTVFDTISELFTNKIDSSKFKEDKQKLNKFISETDKKVNQLMELVIKKYLANDKYLAFQLLDSTVCKDTSIYMSDKLESQLESIELKTLKLLFQKEKYDCNDYNSCSRLISDIKYKSNNKELNKKEICDSIAIFNIRIMNLVAALLVQLDPDNNIAINRMKILFASLNENKNNKTNNNRNNKTSNNTNLGGLHITLCNEKEHKLIEDYGLSELLNLYMYSLLISKESDTISLIEEYNNIINLFSENLSSAVDNVLVNDIKLFTTEIKETLKNFHRNLIESNQLKTPSIDKFNKSHQIKTPSDRITEQEHMIKEQQYKLNEQKQLLQEQSNQITQQSNTLQQQNEKLIEQSEQINQQSSTIDEQKQKLEQLKIETNELIAKLKNEDTESKRMITELQEQLKTVNLKFETMDKEKKAANNAEIAEIKQDIEKIMNKTKYTKLQLGGALSETHERFVKYLSKFTVKNEQLRNKFFNLFDKNLILPDSIKDICNAKQNSNLNAINIPFTAEDKEINNYLNVYNQMSEYYTIKTKEMLKILEDEILDIKYGKNSIIETVNIRSFDEAKLSSLEKRIRLLLAEYINQIHTYYLSGIAELNKYLSRK